MPSATRSCHVPRCPELNCQRHGRAAKRREIDQHRGSASSRGYDANWKRRRDACLAENPLCGHCTREGRTALARIADHVVPHMRLVGDRYVSDPVLFRGPLQGLCLQHDKRKKVYENGLQACAHTEAAALMPIGKSIACDRCGTVVK